MNRKKFLQKSIKAFSFITLNNINSTVFSNSFKEVIIENHKLRFVIFSDGHYGQENTNYLQKHNLIIDWINSENAKKKFDFIVVNGDLFHDEPNYFYEAIEVLNKLKTPWFATHGNHDRISEVIWNRNLGYNYNHAFERKGVGFIFLNTANELGRPIESDLNWLSHTFHSFNNLSSVYLFMHITPFKWTKAGFSQPDLTSFLEKQKNLKAIFHGHDHDEDGLKLFNGKHYFFDGHVAGNWGTPYCGLRIVEIFNNDDSSTYQYDFVNKLVCNSCNI